MTVVQERSLDDVAATVETEAEPTLTDADLSQLTAPRLPTRFDNELHRDAALFCNRSETMCTTGCPNLAARLTRNATNPLHCLKAERAFGATPAGVTWRTERRQIASWNG